jgi:hypothetical protein
MAAVTPVLTNKTVPMPSVEVYFSGLGSGSPTRITVYRLADGETNIVRTANNVAATTAFTVTDYEAPFGVVISYYAEVFNAAGTSLGLSPLATTTLNSDSIWVHDPLDLSNFTVITPWASDSTLAQNSFENIERGYDVNLSNVIGKKKPIIQFYGEKAIQGLEFEVITSTNAAYDALELLLQVAPVLIRTPVRFYNLPRLLYGVLRGSQQPLTWHLNTSNQPITRLKFSVDETEQPGIGLVFAYYTYSYWQARYATYTAANAAYGAGTYVNAVRNPPA